MSSSSVCNHSRDYQIRLPLRGRPILLITRMSADRIGLHSVLLPLLIVIIAFVAFFGRILQQYCIFPVVPIIRSFTSFASNPLSLNLFWNRAIFN